MVASPHPLATEAGVDVLRRGENAVDAAIAANAVLAVVYPASNGIGGDALAYNGGARAPVALDAAAVRARGCTQMPKRGALTVTTPGCVRAWEDVARVHGTRGLDELLAPAEAFAREGYVVTDVVAKSFATNEALLRSDSATSELCFTSGVPCADDVVRNEALATSHHGFPAMAPTHSTKARSLRRFVRHSPHSAIR